MTGLSENSFTKITFKWLFLCVNSLMYQKLTICFEGWIILQAWLLFGFLMHQLVTFQRRLQVEFFATYFTVFQLPTYMRVLVGRQITTSNLLGHSVHENGLSFVWNLIWICRFPFWWNPFPQWVHVNFFSLHHHELGCASLSLML